MSGVRNRLKSGWDSKDEKLKDIRGSNRLKEIPGRNRVAGLVGRRGEPEVDPRDHQSAPLASLKDPASFGPPPKHVDYYGPDAASNAAAPVRSGLGAPLPPSETQTSRGAQASANEEAVSPAPPPVPYRVNTTGLSTDSLPKPPARRPGQEASPVSATNPNKPSLPPRLPSRPSANSSPVASSPPPSYSTATGDGGGAPASLSQGAMSRLGQAGVSVPGLDIGSGKKSQQSQATSSPNTTAASDGKASSQLNELQSRFAKMSSPSSPSSKGEVPSQGTSFAQKQSALRAASSFRNDPSSVSLSDARSAASTANNFRQRHGAEVAQGVTAANGLNQKYGFADRFGQINSGNAEGTSAPASPASPYSPSAASKKPRPPPPPKKNIGASAAATPPSSASPPPVPLSSKPKPT